MKILINKFLYICLFVLCSWFLNAQENFETEFQKRAQLLINHTADIYPRWSNGERPIGFSGNVSDFGKYNYPKIIAVFKKYGYDSTFSSIMVDRLNRYKSLPTFHFNLVGLPRILYLFPDAPGIKGNELEFLKRVFEREDSYNPWTCEGTENHIMMSRTSGYLYAQLALEMFPDSFPQAKEKLQLMKDWMRFYVNAVYHAGTGEYNSSTYNTYNIIGWLNVYDFAKDKEVKHFAKAILDYYAAEYAITYMQANIGGSDMRGKACYSSFDGSSSYLGWLWFGDAPFDMEKIGLDLNMPKHDEYIQTIHAATSNYRIPNAVYALFLLKRKSPINFTNSKSSYLLKDTFFIKQPFYSSPSFSLGSSYLPYGGWSAGNYQIVPWRFLSRVSDSQSLNAQYMSGIGMQLPSKNFANGNHRMPFDQLVQFENVLIQMTRVPENAKQIRDTILSYYPSWKDNYTKDFFIRFPNDKDRENPINSVNLDVTTNRSSIILSNTGKWNYKWKEDRLFIELENSLIMAIPFGDSLTYNPVAVLKDSSLVYFTVNAALNSLCGFIIECHEKSEFNSFNDFIKRGIRAKADFSLIDSLKVS